MEKPNSVIVDAAKVFIGAVDSTDRINFSNQQLYSAADAVKLKIMSILDLHLLLNVSCFNFIK